MLRRVLIYSLCSIYVLSGWQHGKCGISAFIIIIIVIIVLLLLSQKSYIGMWVSFIEGIPTFHGRVS